MKNDNDIVFTGLGVVSPSGIGISSLMDSLINEKSGIQLRDEFAESEWPFRIGGMIKGFEGKKFIKPRKNLKLMCREIQFGFAAATMAIEDAGLDLDAHDSSRLGVVCGTDTFYADPSSLMDSFYTEDGSVPPISEWTVRAMKTIEPLWMLKYLPNMTAAHVAIFLDAQGPNNSIIQRDASGLLAMVEAADAIRRGWADTMVIGGTGSKIHPTFLSYHGTDWLAHPGDDPATACKPFDKQRSGTVASEGAGMILIERRKTADARGAKIYGKLSSFDYGCCNSDEDSQIEFLTKKINGAIQKAGIEKSQVTHVNSHGSAEILSDRIEAKAINNALGDVDVVAFKGNFGNMGPAGGIIESAVSLRALSENRLPGTMNYREPDAECPVNVQAEASDAEQKAAIKISISNTGQMVAVLMEAE